MLSTTFAVMPAETCDSCGADDQPVEPVHRVYVVPESWDTPGSSTTEEGIERWCFPCRTHYPHEPVETEP